MSAPLVPSPLDYIGRSPFAFYPPIGNTDPNEWLLGTGSWSEVQVFNAVSGVELWVPRIFVCGVSDKPGLPVVVELTKELHRASGGGIEPRLSEVIEFPAPVRTGKLKRRSAPATVVGIRIEETAAASSTSFSRFVWFAITILALFALVLAATRL